MNISYKADATIYRLNHVSLLWNTMPDMQRVSNMDRVICLTHWGRVTHICVGELTITVPYNGLSPGRRQAIIWTNAGILLIGPLGTNFSEILIEIQTFSLKKIRLKLSFAKCCSFRLGLNELIYPACPNSRFQTDISGLDISNECHSHGWAK